MSERASGLCGRGGVYAARRVPRHLPSNLLAGLRSIGSKPALLGVGGQLSKFPLAKNGFPLDSGGDISKVFPLLTWRHLHFPRCALMEERCRRLPALRSGGCATVLSPGTVPRSLPPCEAPSGAPLVLPPLILAPVSPMWHPMTRCSRCEVGPQSPQVSAPGTPQIQRSMKPADLGALNGVFAKKKKKVASGDSCSPPPVPAGDRL